MVNKRWTLKTIDKEAEAQLCKDLPNITPALCTLLAARGMHDYEQAKRFFRPELSQLHDPFLMKGMDKAVKRIMEAIEWHERIMVYGDYDVDGTTAVAVVYSFLKEQYPKGDISYYIPHRYREGYGVSRQGIDFAAPFLFSGSGRSEGCYLYGSMSTLFPHTGGLRFADVILPLNMPQALTYGVPEEWQAGLLPGMRVEVSLGRNKQYSGVVLRLHDEAPEAYEVKPIRGVIDEVPVVNERQLRFWQWIAQYYAAAPGEVMQAALLNFVEMRDKVADPAFLERKKIEKELGKKYPDQFVSVYEMVSFSHTPYDTAMRCIRAQDALLEKIKQEGDFFARIQETTFKDQLDKWMDDYHHSVQQLTMEGSNGK